MVQAVDAGHFGPGELVADERDRRYCSLSDIYLPETVAYHQLKISGNLVSQRQSDARLPVAEVRLVRLEAVGPKAEETRGAIGKNVEIRTYLRPTAE